MTVWHVELRDPPGEVQAEGLRRGPWTDAADVAAETLTECATGGGWTAKATEWEPR